MTYKKIKYNFLCIFCIILILTLFIYYFTRYIYFTETFQNNNPSYFITTLCIGDKFEPIREHWQKRINEKTTNAEIVILDETNMKELVDIDDSNISRDDYAWWDIYRLKHNIQILQKYNIPVVHCDLDLIIEKNITPIINMDYDMIISTEHYGANAMPKDCSSKLGFGLCTGFYILKPTCMDFIQQIYEHMLSKKYNSYSDQITLMNYITKHSDYTVTDEPIILEGSNVEFHNKIIYIDNIKICVLDFDLITRDPIKNNNQYGNHIHIENVGGTQNFIRFFYEQLENLPSTTASY